ncbi:MAG: hypothetical protein ACRD2C_07680 [Acidimicrobiales bacterium]
MFGVAVLALVALALVTDAGNDPDSGGSGSGSSEGSGQRQATTSVAPPDVDEPRAGVDLAVVPTGDDPVEVARWWAASYTAYIGSEAPDALADRLAPTTTEDLQAQLAAIPPAASYDSEPVAVEGVSQRAPVEEGDRVEIRLTVETVGALTVYDLVVVRADGSGGVRRWLVDEANRV